jgi:hypothetical protein
MIRYGSIGKQVKEMHNANRYLSGRQGREGSEHQGSKNKIGSLKKQ